jgi:hypothetical protein
MPMEEMNYEMKADEMWQTFDENERALVAIGVFPNRQMADAEKAGYETHPLVVALMRHEQAHPGSKRHANTP